MVESPRKWPSKSGEKEVLEPTNTQKEEFSSPYTLPSPSPSKLFNILSGASYEEVTTMHVASSYD